MEKQTPKNNNNANSQTPEANFVEGLIESTKVDAISNVKLLVLGETGIGKTNLIKTLPVKNPQEVLIISSEEGNQVLRKKDYKTIYLVKALSKDAALGKDSKYKGDMLLAALDIISHFWAKPESIKGFKWIVIDSFTDIGEKKISWNKKHPSLFLTKQGNVDTLSMYGDLKDKMLTLVNRFLFIPGINKYGIAACTKTEEGLKESFSMMVEGSSKESIPYHFDDVFYIKLKKDEAGNVIFDDNGYATRELVTNKDGIYMEAKSRTDGYEKLIKLYEPADLGYIYKKAYGQIEASA